MRSAMLVPVLLIALPASAQIKPLRESPAAMVSLDLGLTNVKVVYHRPAVKGREIWGGLVPYGEVWRTGANEATTLTFSGAVKVEGKDVPAGTYAFFAVPGKDHWTLILNTEAEQWGAFNYKKEKDLLRFDVKPEPAPMAEWLAYDLVPTSDHAARVELAWEKLKVGFTVEVDVQGNYRKLVLDAVAKADPKDQKGCVVFFQAAQYWFKQKLDDAQALAWVDTSLTKWDSFWPHELKARLLERTGKKAEALAEMEKAIQIAKARTGKDAPPKAYIDNLEKDLAAWKK